jgi:hypothetical protein
MPLSWLHRGFSPVTTAGDYDGPTVLTVSHVPGKPLKRLREVGTLLYHRAKAKVLMRTRRVTRKRTSLKAEINRNSPEPGQVTHSRLHLASPAEYLEYSSFIQ